MFFVAAKQALKFTVYRDDDFLFPDRLSGNFSFRPGRGARRLKVDIDVDLEVKMMFVTAFIKFRHVASEIWENGQLLSMIVGK